MALAALLSQAWMSYLFIVGSEYDLSSDQTDLVYTWKCPRDTDTCGEDNGKYGSNALLCVFSVRAYVCRAKSCALCGLSWNRR